MNLLIAAADSGESSLSLMQVCGDVLHVAAMVVGGIGVLIIILGVVRGTVMFIRSEITGSKTLDRNALRMGLGYYLLLGLEFLVAADIIETLLAPDLEHVLVLGAIVVIRTVISISLNWELKQHAQHAADPTN